MKKKLILILIIIVVIIIGVLLNKENVVNAPIMEKNIEQKNNKSNENKNMQLEIKTTQEGTGERQVKNGDTISVHYTGRLLDGTKFDSSLDRGVPFEFTVGAGMVIQGWEHGFIGAKVGEKRTLIIPAELGYGSRPSGPIPANSTLVFDIELISIK